MSCFLTIELMIKVSRKVGCALGNLIKIEIKSRKKDILRRKKKHKEESDYGVVQCFVEQSAKASEC